MATGDASDLNQARALWANDQYGEALELFDRCLEEQPENPFVLIDAARVRGQWFDQPAMESLVERLLTLRPDDAGMHLQAGMTYRMSYRPDAALEELGKAVRMRKGHTVALLELALLQERTGHLREAMIAADRCLKSSPALPEALVVKARILLRQKRDREAGLILRKLAGMPEGQIAVDTRGAALASYARILERRGEYGAALVALKKAKQPLVPLAEPFLEKQRTGSLDISAFFDSLTPEHLRDWREASASGGGASVVLMTSFPRSGTTLLESMLGSHPDIVASDEMDVFPKRVLPPIVKACHVGPAEGADGFSALGADMLEDLRASYLAGQENALGESLEGKILLDKNPSYTVFIPFFLRLFPDLKLLIPLRDPRDVILSCYFQHFPMNPFSARLIELRGAAERFVHDMGYWIEMREMLDTEQWHEVSYEDLTADPQRELQSLLEFLGVGWDESVLDFQSGGVTIHNAPTYADVQGGVYQGAKQRWRHYEEEFEPLRELLEPVMGKLGYAW